MTEPVLSPLPGSVLVVDDIPSNRNLLRQTLEPQGYEVLLAPDGETALRIAEDACPEVILLDVIMPSLNGFETCRRLKQAGATRAIPVIFITARDETESMLEGFRAGGVDYITKPFQPDEVLLRVQTHLTLHRQAEELRRKNQELEAEIAKRQQAEASLRTADEKLSLLTQREAARWGLEGFVGRSAAVQRLVQDIRRLHQFGLNTGVLISGESGTGKELVARAIHYGHPQIKGAFVAVNCSAIPAELFESTLFGHLKGAFTGAVGDRKGCFEQADGGTLFLDDEHPSELPEERILAFAGVHGTISNPECRELLGVGMQRACYLLRKLHLAGRLERDHSRRWARYRLPSGAPIIPP